MQLFKRAGDRAAMDKIQYVAQPRFVLLISPRAYVAWCSKRPERAPVTTCTRIRTHVAILPVLQGQYAGIAIA